VNDQINVNVLIKVSGNKTMFALMRESEIVCPCSQVASALSLAGRINP